jgi:hypothetical protein
MYNYLYVYWEGLLDNMVLEGSHMQKCLFIVSQILKMFTNKMQFGAENHRGFVLFT